MEDDESSNADSSTLVTDLDVSQSVLLEKDWIISEIELHQDSTSSEVGFQAGSRKETASTKYSCCKESYFSKGIFLPPVGRSFLAPVRTSDHQAPSLMGH